MEKLDHPNIISLYEEIETLDKFYCILEYVDGGEFELLPTCTKTIDTRLISSICLFFESMPL